MPAAQLGVHDTHALVPIPIGTDHEVPCRQIFVIYMHVFCSMSFLFLTTKRVNMYHVLICIQHF